MTSLSPSPALAPTPRHRGRPPKTRRPLSANALRHGVLSTNPVIAGIEQQSDWKDHLDAQIDALKPLGARPKRRAFGVGWGQLWVIRVGGLGRSPSVNHLPAALLDNLGLALTHRIALTLWRLNRLIAFERYALRPSERYISDLTALRSGPDGATATLDRVFPTGSIEHVQRYEAHLHRIFLKDLHELEALQARRRGDPTPLARVEIN